MAEELVTVIGDGRAARMALEEFDTEIALQLLDRLGHRRLGNRQVLGSAGDRALLGDGDEILQLTEGEGHGLLKHGTRLEARRSAGRW